LKIEVNMLPPAELSPNARCHWAEKYRASQDYLKAVYYSCLEALATNHTEHRALIPLRKARLNLTFVFPQGRRRDKDNLVAMFKPGLDALVKVGLLEDDDSKHLTIGGVKVEVDKERAPLTIIELEEIYGTGESQGNS
jgi:Holliday junction resolvase RusA-like endonuclease